ncbi:hypothetical protein I552_5084 [Mycobacterium xenopi 3993]|nr:hypothetical protein I552_5084 [Mycobacterium xenopi 3993]
MIRRHIRRLNPSTAPATGWPTTASPGTGMIDLRSLARLSGAQSRSISPENFDGAKGGGARAADGTGAACAADLGRVEDLTERPRRRHTTFELAGIEGPALITHIWLTTDRSHWRSLILRCYWDRAEEPAVEVPLGDFFGQGWCEFAQLSSVPVAVNPHGGFNSYWPMPAPRHARLTLENRASHPVAVYYQISYEIDVDVTGAGYLHSQFHRSNPLAVGTVHPILDRVRGRASMWAPTSPGVSTARLGGRGRGQVLLRRRREVSHDLRHRHRGLFRRRLELRRARPGLHRVLDTVPRPAPDHPSRRPVPQPAAVRHVPLAPAGPHSLPR